MNTVVGFKVTPYMSTHNKLKQYALLFLRDKRAEYIVQQER
jgi:hypothetical protein